MCGIFCVFNENCYSHNNDSTLLNTYEACKTQLARRGPDFQCMRTIVHGNYNFVVAASVLWLQGREATKQPIETDKSMLVYNGNLYRITSLSNKSSNDTEILLENLEHSEDIYLTLLKVQGPFAFIYLDKQTSKLYFARDLYGRRSLLIGKQGDNIVLTSIANKAMCYDCIELPALGIFCYDLNLKNIELMPWKYKHKDFEDKIKELERCLNKTVNINESNSPSSILNYFPPAESDLLLYKQLENIPFHESLSTLLENHLWKSKVENLTELLSAAVQKRILAQPQFCQNCIERCDSCNHTLTGILFSGGVDCTILALIADLFVDRNRAIDLLNVAFSNNAPDRHTALETWKELKILRPNRNWNLVEINVTQDELEQERRKHIADLIYPRNTILDDSLGCAMWFASKGQNEKYKSPCRVLLVGTGADELFGGYTKYRAAYKNGSWLGVHEALNLDWQNISHRNLARDDRVVSDHGRQLCMPYLDEDVVEFVRNLSCWERTCPTKDLPHGLGEKILLRSLAYYLGLKNAAYFKKRALQFGSRIANSKENANDVSPRL
ncbi:hypothetical protein ILUMI_11191 [Ignelater luminosus]|uniref:Glutamine amidotransferase type-2 domain-containing protein n=1 Tax=Ignelater luminosus TaxID=2038154 RepID=A0A8K0GE57_IGNLU|nr:hypothetical protein ILUMI_11191 [Ignelater luminosus]